MSLWYLGIAFSAAGSLAASFGNHLIKYSHRKHGGDDISIKESCKSPLWVCGILMITVIASGLNLGSLAFAAQSILAPMAGFTLVCNIVINPCLLREKIIKWDIAGTVVIFGGITLCVLGGPQSNATYDLNGLIELYKQPAFLVYGGVMIVLMIVLLLASRGVFCGFGQMLSGPILAGALGGFTTLFAKSAVEVFTTSISADGSNQFIYVGSYVLIVLGFGFAASQLIVFNTALIHYNAMYVVPVYQSALLIFTAIAGAVYFQEGDDLTLGGWLMFLGGIIITVIGIVVLSQRLAKKDDKEETESADDDVPATDLAVLAAEITRAARSDSGSGVSAASSRSASPTRRKAEPARPARQNDEELAQADVAASFKSAPGGLRTAGDSNWAANDMQTQYSGSSSEGTPRLEPIQPPGKTARGEKDKKPTSAALGRRRASTGGASMAHRKRNTVEDSPRLAAVETVRPRSVTVESDSTTVTRSERTPRDRGSGREEDSGSSSASVSSSVVSSLQATPRKPSVRALPQLNFTPPPPVARTPTETPRSEAPSEVDGASTARAGAAGQRRRRRSQDSDREVGTPRVASARRVETVAWGETQEGTEP